MPEIAKLVVHMGPRQRHFRLRRFLRSVPNLDVREPGIETMIAQGPVEELQALRDFARSIGCSTTIA